MYVDCLPCFSVLLLTSHEEGQQADDVACGADEDADGAEDPAEEVSWAGGKVEVDVGGVQALKQWPTMVTTSARKASCSRSRVCNRGRAERSDVSGRARPRLS